MLLRGRFHLWRSAGPAVVGAVVSPSAPAATTRTDPRYRELDVHRGVAALGVVVFSVYQFCNVDHFLYYGTWGYTVLNSLDAAVPWFFVITAFLLYRPIARSVIDGSDSRISVRGFLLRRAIRVLPVYYVAVSLVWFVRQTSLPGDWRDLLEHLTFTQIFDERRIFYTIGPAWSISVAVYFCLVLVVLGVSLPRWCRHLATRRQRMSVLAATVAALAMCSVGWKAWAFATGQRPSSGAFTTWFGPVANVDAFAVGMAVAILAEARRGASPLGRRGRSTLRFAAVSLLSVAFVWRQADGWSGVYFLTLCSVGFGCLVAAAVLGPSAGYRRRKPGIRPFRWLGAISFSLYLWHEPVLLALAGLGLIAQSPDAFGGVVAIVVVVSVVVAWLSYVLVERPTSRLRQMFRDDGHLARTPPAGRALSRVSSSYPGR